MSVERDRPPADAAGIPVLLYHSVADAPPAGQQQQFTVTPARFAEHVAMISASGRRAMTISELASALSGRRALPERPVAVTFDDGFDDTPPAVSRLWAAGISSTVYVTTGNIGTPRGISPGGLAALVDTGAELGAHTVSHPHLDELPARAAASEIGDSRRQLEEHLGSTVATFAYPHGDHGRRVRAAVIAAGFTSAAAVKNALSHRGDDPFAIARWTVMHDTSTEQLARILAGDGAPLAWARERYRTRAYREARRMRRRLRSITSAPAERRR
jgi:peptidoglycan/xylan/chitin deacetylase (PgdA/CDA1 family)